jgi:hypothetical protein
VSHESWGPQEQAEYDAMIERVLAASSNSTERARLLLSELDAGEQARRFWAGDIAREIAHDGARQLITREAKGRVPRIAVSQDGVPIGKVHRVIGTRTRTDEGKTAYVQTLFDYLPFDSLREKADEIALDIAGNRRNLVTVNRLLDLDGRAEGDCPADVCRSLGITVEAWLTGAAA